ncbi:Xaa-Pro peptidase family protein [Motiliproteus sp. MSK22-1]|uniref:M24 family metallopeptidase n=1 Tax=Motiliproteus sp. MSK22-1 TaxID=1897630 RepID=UPI000978A9B8|nr:Xaa-Pro peptidase family protein [Motiliproteus sp. MSK22-1]OMH33857.1 X-Pro dipeptidase [Motiliproteus sp. MSK22-1]
MTIGVGGSTAKEELEKLRNMTADIQPVSQQEFQQRIAAAQKLMQQQGITVTYLNAGTNLYYFTGTGWHPSERMVGALLPAKGDMVYIAPHFELNTLKQYMQVQAEVATWQEHECPYALAIDVLNGMGIHNGKFAIDESTAFFISNGMDQQANDFQLVSATPVTGACRMIKSATELALMQRAKDMTLTVQKAAARILRNGITTLEVTEFIDEAHRRVGAPSGSYFCIVLFGEDSSFPHGVKQPKALETNDMVLIDTGCQIEGYISDITRSYVFGTADDRQRKMWAIEKAAQDKAFQAAQIGQPCGEVDIAARTYLADQGLGPDYQTPGCPHRTGHGIGLDIHEWPYLVKSNQTPLAAGMCFSNEPMLVVPGEFGIRLEDHFYMTDQGPEWFTQPSHSIDDPFGYRV